MAIDGPTLILISFAIAAIATGFLLLEWRAGREPALLAWAGGFAMIVLGCGIAPLREARFDTIGMWVADGLLIAAHLGFLTGTGCFAGRSPSLGWASIMIPWLAIGALPLPGDPTLWLGLANAALVSIIALRTGWIGLTSRHRGAGRLGAIFVVHGLFYALKAVAALQPGAFAGLTHFDGLIIQVSLVEGVIVEMVLTLTMVDAVRRRRERRIIALADRDPLTQAFNRRAFVDRAARLLSAAPADRPLGALMLLDIDHFKPVNDTFGHAVGDETLVALTRILDTVLPRSALIARYGGDEFVVLLPDAARPLVAALGDAVCGEFAQSNRSARHMPIAATVSIGAAMVADHGRDLDRLLSAADAAAYAAKQRGGDQIWIEPPAGSRLPRFAAA
jgi:diguanylate cyclase (GGDEF)-like protein